MPLLGSDSSVTGPFPKGVLLLETLTGREVLGLPYLFELELLSRDHNLEPDAVLGQPLAVGLRLGRGDFRYFHGIVTSFAKTGTARLHTRYAATLEPALRQLAYAADCRVFNEASQNALGIVTAVLAGRGVTDVDSGSVADHAFRVRELCVQYRESDLNFAQRLLEEEGVYYFFRHEESKHTLVLADAIAAHATVPGYETVLYTPEERRVAGAEEHFWGMRVGKGLYPGRHTVLAGYDPTLPRPRQLQLGEARSREPTPGSQFEHYDYPAGLCDPEEAEREARVRNQADHALHTLVEVDGNTMGLGVGDLVTLRPSLSDGEVFPFWRPDDVGKQLLIVGATYHVSIDQYETGTVSRDEPFGATYRLLDAQTQFRPRRTAPKPRMGGPQTARVVGPPGEEIWTDKLGRIRIQFDWDRQGGLDEKSTCWVRMAETWAGARWGAIHLPRIGQEVLVRFLEGDPDRPIAVAGLYSADNPPPYELPANATQSGIKSRSSKGGAAGNFNEIRFEDKKGAEELHVQAERDMSTLVKHRQALRVGANRGIVVGRNEDNLVKDNRELTVRADDDRVPVKDSVVIDGAHDKTITGPVLQIYGDSHSRKVDGEQELVAEKNKNEHVRQAFTLTTDKKFQLNQDATSLTFKSKNVTLDAGGEITVMAGGATVSVDQAGLTTFESPAGIKLTCGGSSVSVMPGGIALSGPAFAAAAGGGSKMSVGSDAIAISSKKVTIEAAGVCKLRGKKALKLQESEPVKAKRKGAGGGAGEKGEAGASAKVKRPQKGAVPGSPTLEIHVVDLDGKPPEGLAFEIKKPDGGTEQGKLDGEGRAKVESTAPGTFIVTFPDLDGGDWDGDGAEDLRDEQRSEADKVTATSEDRVPAIARDHGFLNWCTVWDFAGNASLKSLRENPNVLWDGDQVAIPSKVQRRAEVQGGTAEYVVNRSEERVLNLRLLDEDLRPLAGVRYEANVGDLALNRGVVPKDGFITLEVPTGTDRVVVSTYLADDKDVPPLEWSFEVQEDPLGNSAEHKAQRLINLGLAAELPEGDKATPDLDVALAQYRSRVQNHEDDDEDLVADLVAIHDAKDEP